MAKKRAKKAVKQPSPSPSGPTSHGGAEDPLIEPGGMSPIDLEVERQSAAIGAIRDVEIERLLTRLRLLRSYFSDQQLQTPVLQFFRENLPNLLIERDGGNGEFEVKWKDKEEDNLCGEGTADVHASLLKGLSAAYPECSNMSSFRRFEFSGGAGRMSFFGADSLQVFEEPSDSQMLGMQDGLRTPGVSNQRMSIGMTPKTLRLPKAGEMLLSVRGSPLGVFKEENMEAIHESDEA